MERRTWALHILTSVRRAMGKENDAGSDGTSTPDRTRDGTLDMHGQPASKKTTGGWRAALFILVLQILTNMAYYGVANNLVIYLTTVMHQGTALSAKNVSNWNGTGSITPLIAAFLADSCLGRYRTALISCLIYIVGLGLLTVSASVVLLHPPQCPSEDFKCVKGTLGQVAFLDVGLYVMSLGAGGVYGTITAFGADQFDEEDQEEKKQKSSFFNWFYQCIFTGSLIASTFCVYIQDKVSWGLGWGISNAALVVGSCFLVMGAPLYRYHKPVGNPVTRISQVLVAAFRKRKVPLPSSSRDLHEDQETETAIQGTRTKHIQHSNKFMFLDKAATVSDTDGDAMGNQTHLCTVTQVEEVKFVISVLPIWLTSIMYSAVYSQILTLFVMQGATMDLRVGSVKIPPASLSVFESSSVILWVIVYDCLLVPYLCKRTGNPRGMSELQRIGIGLALSIIAMTLAATVELIRLRKARKYHLRDEPNTPIPMTVFWEVPQYFVMGASEVFTYIGLLEFFYNQAPPAIRSVGSSLSMLAVALGNFFSSVLVTGINRIVRACGYGPGWIADNLNQGRIDLFYWLLTVLSFFNLVAFLLCANRYEYVKTIGVATTTGLEQFEPDEGDFKDQIEPFT